MPVWQNALNLSDVVFELNNVLPKSEDYGFKSKIEDFINNSKTVHFIPNWATTSSVSAGTGAISLDEGTNFTFVGNIGKVQNIENCIHGFRRFQRNQKT